MQLVYVAEGAETAIDSTLAFYLSPKSAYVSGQVVRIGATGTKQGEARAPASRSRWRARSPSSPAPRAASASRSPGCCTATARGCSASTCRRPPASCSGVTKDLDGDSLTLDITTKDAPQRIAQYVEQTYGAVDIVVHNAGITRDKKLQNMAEDRFASVVSVNLVAPEKITRELLDQGLIKDNGRIIGVSSMAGIAGNVGQTNYAASKAGVIGFVDTLAGELKKGITINAVAPGFIATKMTDAMPLASREVGQRLNAMAQAGQPVDVAEAIAWYASPGSTAVNGNVVRVCGQMMLGA